MGTATRRVCSLAYAATERQEMPATLAAMYLLYKEGRIASHTFVPLVVPQLLAFHEGDAASTTVVPAKVDGGATRGSVFAGGAAANGNADADDEGALATAVGEDIVRVADVEDATNNGPRCFVLMYQTLDYRLRHVALSGFSPYAMYEQYKKRRISAPVRRDRRQRVGAHTGNPGDGGNGGGGGGATVVGGSRTATDVAAASTTAAAAARGGGCSGHKLGTAAAAPPLLPLFTEHPQHKTHHRVRCDPLRVPRIVGPRLPDRDAMKGKEDARELYGAFALVIFTTWRTRGDLRGTADISWWDANQATQVPPYAVAKLRKFQSWNDGCDKKRQRARIDEKVGANNDTSRETERNVGAGAWPVEGLSDEGGEDSDGAVSIDREARLGRDGDGDGSGDGAPLDFLGALGTDEGGFEMPPARRHICKRAELSGLVDAVALVHTGEVAAECGLPAGVEVPLPTLRVDEGVEPLLTRVAAAAGGAIVGGDGPPAKALDGMLQAACEGRRTFDDDSLRDASAAFEGLDEEALPAGASTHAVVTIELLDALQEGSQCLAHSGGEVSAATKAEAAGLTPRSWPPPVLSAAAVAEIFTLNTEQRRAFQECAVTFAAQWAKGQREVAALDTGAAPSSAPATRHGVADVIDDTPADGQLLIYLGGTTGAGKSRVTEAVRFFSLRWARERSVVCAAPTGVAAANIDRSTLDSRLKLTLSGKQKKATLALVRFFSGAELVIIDELSMISADFLAVIEQRLRQVGRAGVVFGGLSVVLSGDLQQLPPVVSPPFWTAGRPPAAGNERDNARYVRRLRGVQVWRCF